MSTTKASSTVIQAGSNSSALHLVPLLSNLLHPKSVLDVGGGIGEWLQVWQKYGVEDFLDVDGKYISTSQLLIPKSKFLAHDLTRPLKLGRKFDLVMSLEVAEHLDNKVAEIFVESLTRHADTIFFSAAIPGQGGTHHVNEQWPSYWAKKFIIHGYQCFDVIRPLVWNLDIVDFWYRQNSLIFATKAASEQYGLVASKAPLNIVHPRLLTKLIKKGHSK
ncbi:MAG: methyltransferase domain-containing protein [Candidatus Saccharibacteria bacterium]